MALQQDEIFYSSLMVIVYTSGNRKIIGCWYNKKLPDLSTFKARKITLLRKHKVLGNVICVVCDGEVRYYSISLETG